MRDGTGFPVTPFVVQIGDEKLRVTAVGTTWTVVRGVSSNTTDTRAPQDDGSKLERADRS